MDLKITINKKRKKIQRDELETLNKEQLIEKIFQLDAYNIQLKNILQKNLDNKSKQREGKEAGCTILESKDTTKNSSTKRKFDFSKSHRRHILLRLLYFGWDYQGFAVQENSNSTIEYYLFKALMQTCLIESRETSNYYRCGRTDKSVSAFCQVISIDVRSKYPKNEQFVDSNIQNEIDYCDLLNRVLPNNVRAICWMPIKNEFYSARFDCFQRSYRYFFPSGNLNIEAMRNGCKFLVGHHDFRNFCKMDVNNGVTQFKRHVIDCDIFPCHGRNLDKGYDMYYFQITANAFLWHQIRCIMAVLLLIGKDKESPSVILDLLDIEKTPSKPQYTQALGLPLNLYKCEFRDYAEKTNDGSLESENSEMTNNREKDLTEWIFSNENILKLFETLQGEWCKASVKSTMVREVISGLEELTNKKVTNTSGLSSQIRILQDCVRQKHYQKLLARKRCESLENRITHFVKKQRLVIEELEKDIEQNSS